MSFVLPVQRPCLKFFTSAAYCCSQHWSLLHVHHSFLLGSSYTGQCFFCPLDSPSPIHHFVTVVSIAHICWLNHPQLNIAYLPMHGPHTVPLESLHSLCSFDNILSLAPVEWSGGVDDIRYQEGLWDSQLARSCVLLLQYSRPFYWWIAYCFRNLYFWNSGLQIRNMFRV